MIDSLKIKTPDFEVMRGASLDGLRVDPGRVVAATGEHYGDGLLFTAPGHADVFGSKAYLNARGVSPFNFTIVRDRTGQVTAVVDLSLAGYGNGGANVDPPTRRGAADSVGDVQRRLRDIGIRADLEAAKLSRVDLFRNVRAEAEFICYRATLDRLTMVRAVESRYYGTSYLWRGSRRALSVYDKLAQIAAKRKEAKKKGNAEAVEFLDRAAARLQGQNVFRFEMRLMRRDTLRAELKTETWGGLLSRWDRLDGIYTDFWRRSYFKAEPAQFELRDDLRDFASPDGLEASILESARRNSKQREKFARNWWACFRMEQGAVRILEIAGPDVLLEEVIRRVHLVMGATEQNARMYAKRKVEDLKRKTLVAQQERLFKDGRSVAEQYAELRRAVCGPVLNPAFDSAFVQRATVRF